MDRGDLKIGHGLILSIMLNVFDRLRHPIENMWGRQQLLVEGGWCVMDVRYLGGLDRRQLLESGSGATSDP